MRKIKIKIAKIKKNNTYTCIILTDPQMQKEFSKPFDSELCGSWRPADYDSPHIQTCQQSLIKDLTISDIHHGLKFTWGPLTNSFYVSTSRRQQRRQNDLMKNSNVQHSLRRIIVSSMNPMGQLSPRRPSIEGSHQTPKGELLMMTYAHCHSSHFHTNSMILTSSTWPQYHVKTDNG